MHLGAGELLQQNAGDLRRGVLVDELGLARIGLHPGDELVELVRRQVFLGDQELRVDRDQPDRLEVLLQIVVEVVDDAADVGVPLADVDGVAVGRRARDAPDRDAAAGAADVLDDDRLAEDAAACFSAMMRAATSVDPPGGNGTTSVIWRDGKVCACAPAMPANAASAIAMISFLMPCPARCHYRQSCG